VKQGEYWCRADIATRKRRGEYLSLVPSLGETGSGFSSEKILGSAKPWVQGLAPPLNPEPYNLKSKA